MATKVDYASSSLGDAALEAAYDNALRLVRDAEPKPEQNLVGGLRHSTGEVVKRFDPCREDSLVGAAYAATPELVLQAVEAARGVKKSWAKTSYGERNAMLRQVAADVGDRLVELAAILSAETGKNRLEAFGEAQEVLDMIEHYCTLMEKNDGYLLQQKSTEAEKNYDLLVPYGVFAVISPFNFPAALAVGMTTGALVTGNTVVLKPSDKTPRSTAFVADIFAAHLPEGVINVVHGGAQVGQWLAGSEVDGIAFTGSAQVGWQLFELKGPRGLQRPVLAEMGGQNPAIVARSADLDAAAAGIVRSAFGLSGQKCSACRRVIVDDAVADELIAKIVRLADGLVVGDPADPRSNLGPVIDDAIATRIDQALELARRDGTVHTGGRMFSLPGNYYRPIVVSDLPRGHRLTREELFAPFLSIIRVSSFDEALEEANAVDYGLSAGVFSNEPGEVEQFLDEIEAGVLYVNRAAGATTGAWPGIQSFCGWKRSGTAGKGGLGIWYLPGFMREQNRTIVVAP
ncbi:aldehyde dehydrogenase family protein [Arthrobacter mobilis]|uniref:L-glutamate gamma-semialdehyde dehydrogenase n=1 Tax=Arthrobacter mobilis TaxID=2724944 RepID=A0A7X6K6A4_9MICC|nr:aldehyde dehydrogenase family protein [Arthrobacter mobilis]NKX55419.1 aldehyde dehydrogenase family protein [Arthrobacter mobilis]